jgi:hypothetical protein
MPRARDGLRDAVIDAPPPRKPKPAPKCRMPPSISLLLAPLLEGSFDGGRQLDATVGSQH